MFCVKIRVTQITRVPRTGRTAAVLQHTICSYKIKIILSRVTHVLGSTNDRVKTKKNEQRENQDVPDCRKRLCCFTVLQMMVHFIELRIYKVK